VKCNNSKDLDVRLETIASVKDRPSAAVFAPSDRDKTWLRLYDQHKGKIDADFGKLAFTTPPLAAYHSVDAKFTTSDMAKELKTYALFGPPLGKTWQPTFEERQKFPEVKPLVGNPWTILHSAAPAKSKADGPAVVDLHDPERGGTRVSDPPRDPHTEAAWHGTLLPKNDADVWLAVGFAHYERYVALEKALRKRSNGTLTAADQARLALELFAARATYNLGARAGEEKALADTKADVRQDNWYQVASGKGELLLHQLRQLLGPEVFDSLMEEYGKTHAGQSVTTADFRAFMEKETNKHLDVVFDAWLNATGLPHPLIGNPAFGQLLNQARGEKVEIVLRQKAKEPEKFTATIVSVEEQIQSVGKDKVQIEVLNLWSDAGTRTAKLAEVQRLRFLNPATEKELQKETTKAGGAPPAGTFSVLTFHHELEQTLIVYGTSDEANTNREAAEALQRGIVKRHSNYTVPIKSDRDVTDDDLKTHHVILIGRPECNRLTARYRDALPVQFGPQSFTVRDAAYAHQGSAVVVAAENPLNKRFSLVVLAGLNGSSTLRTATQFMQLDRQAEVVVYPNGGAARALVVGGNGGKAAE
jgi:hypothetical protein